MSPAFSPTCDLRSTTYYVRTMFKKILVALDHSEADAILLGWVKQLARLTGAQLLLLHVSTGWRAQWQTDLNLADSEEMQEDRAYLRRVEHGLGTEGLRVEARHASGKPADEILKTARLDGCDLIAMATHGHHLLLDIIYGETIDRVRHEAEIPLFVVRAQAQKADGGKQKAVPSG
jgi:nucleotide-binding universal stress UspA family protein